MIKAVVFDLGKVLLDFDYGIASRNIAAKGRMSADEVRAFISNSPLLLRYEAGLLTSGEFYQEMCGSTGYCGALEDFQVCFGNIFEPIEPMIRLQADLRSRGLLTFIFSNTNEFAVRYIRQNYPFFSNFDDYILSYEHGAMKPEAKIYEVVEQRTGRQGPEILYLDDRPENIAAGAARNWQVILQESPEKTHAAIRQLGLLD